MVFFFRNDNPSCPLLCSPFNFQTEDIFKGRIFRMQKRDANTLRASTVRRFLSRGRKKQLAAKAQRRLQYDAMPYSWKHLAWAAGLAKRPVGSRRDAQIRLGVNRNYRCDRSAVARLRNASPLRDVILFSAF